MKVGILAGGVGSRLSEETVVKPKPMVEIGGRPILWHIMEYYASFGFDEFAVALGYKGEFIKRWFFDEVNLTGDLTVKMGEPRGEVTQHMNKSVDWEVQLIETGRDTNTGGRIKRLLPYLGNETCMLTWGDGLSTVDLHALLDYHRSHGKLATLTAVRPPARFGHIDIAADGHIQEFSEKPQAAEGWINGAFFVLEPGVGDYIDGDETLFEREPLERLAKDGELMAFRHDGFWACMDTLRDRVRLEEFWQSGNAPWAVNS